MKKIVPIALNIIFCFNALAQNDLDIVKSDTFEVSNELYSSSIDEYKKNEFWGIWSVSLDESKVSSYLPNANGIDYSSENFEDYDLNTAWMVPNYGIGEYIEFDLKNESGAYQFQGICNLFNGYCKSLALWKANSRVKRLKVCYNDLPVCYVDLIDTWHFQSFDISKYLELNDNSPSADFLRFEIIDVYPGAKYKDVGFSEFLCEGTGN